MDEGRQVAQRITEGADGGDLRGAVAAACLAGVREGVRDAEEDGALGGAVRDRLGELREGIHAEELSGDRAARAGRSRRGGGAARAGHTCRGRFGRRGCQSRHGVPYGDEGLGRLAERRRALVEGVQDGREDGDDLEEAAGAEGGGGAGGECAGPACTPHPASDTPPPAPCLSHTPPGQGHAGRSECLRALADSDEGVGGHLIGKVAGRRDGLGEREGGGGLGRREQRQRVVRRQRLEDGVADDGAGSGDGGRAASLLLLWLRRGEAVLRRRRALRLELEGRRRRLPRLGRPSTGGSAGSGSCRRSRAGCAARSLAHGSQARGDRPVVSERADADVPHCDIRAEGRVAASRTAEGAGGIDEGGREMTRGGRWCRTRLRGPTDMRLAPAPTRLVVPTRELECVARSTWGERRGAGGPQPPQLI